MEIRIGIRPSNLALKQAQEGIGLLRKLFSAGTLFTIIKIPTTGDNDKKTPLSEVEGADFFTKEIDEAVLSGVVDIAIHSSKDLPDRLAKGLRVIYETKSISPYDALVSREGLKLKDLPAGSRIGSSSARRKAAISSLRSDPEIVDIRGTIEERLALLDNGSIDALIVAHAALLRLGLEKRATEILDPKIFITHPKQGSLSFVASSASRFNR